MLVLIVLIVYVVSLLVLLHMATKNRIQCFTTATALSTTYTYDNVTQPTVFFTTSIYPTPVARTYVQAPWMQKYGYSAMPVGKCSGRMKSFGCPMQTNNNTCSSSDQMSYNPFTDQAYNLLTMTFVGKSASIKDDGVRIQRDKMRS